ncbi:MAG: deoxyhypusine synthase family protein [Nitrospirae bacterium]|nr:deoxyhypusine synthase family protein [Nitrospirota bacterium]
MSDNVNSGSGKNKAAAPDPAVFSVKRYSLAGRKSKVALDKIGRPYERGGLFREFLSSLPDILAAADLMRAAASISEAREAGRPVILGMGAHPIKVGLSPVIIDLMESGVITAIATNGASIVHDFELAFAGYTSEDVAAELCKGMFGMAEETGVMLNRAIVNGVDKGLGLGKAVGSFLLHDKAVKNKEISIFARACELEVPVTVHVAIGTDIIHMHPEADGRAIGEGSLRDFRLLATLLRVLEGGVFINLGSAVIIPEVFMKALNLARNTGSSGCDKIERFTAINMDFINHYRAQVNVLKRPAGSSGAAINLIGHHEIMFPLLAAAVKEGLKGQDLDGR